MGLSGMASRNASPCRGNDAIGSPARTTRPSPLPDMVRRSSLAAIAALSIGRNTPSEPLVVKAFCTRSCTRRPCGPRSAGGVSKCAAPDQRSTGAPHDVRGRQRADIRDHMRGYGVLPQHRVSVHSGHHTVHSGPSGMVTCTLHHHVDHMPGRRIGNIEMGPAMNAPNNAPDRTLASNPCPLVSLYRP